jgi:hypothetical protein
VVASFSGYWLPSGAKAAGKIRKPKIKKPKSGCKMQLQKAAAKGCSRKCGA